MNIDLHIERLVLDGLPVTRSKGPLLQTAVETELARLLTIEGLPPNLAVGGAFPLIKAGNIQLANSNPNQLGQQIARAVHGSISQ
jgi:hypothetical protein